jgi:hypothetical protein
VSVDVAHTDPMEGSYLIVCALRRDVIDDVLVSTVDRFSVYLRMAHLAAIDRQRMIQAAVFDANLLGRYETMVFGKRELTWSARTWKQAVKNHEAACALVRIALARPDISPL